MNGSEFSKSLLKSSKIDAPLSNAKTRALAHVEQALRDATTTANAAAATANAITSTKLAVAIGATAVIAGAAGMGGGYTLAHLSPRPQPIDPQTHESISASPSPLNGVALPTVNPSMTIASPAPSAAPANSTEPAAAADSCKSIAVEPSNKCSVDGGHTVTFAVKNDCSSTPLDFFWVDQSCREIYRGMVSPSQLSWQDSWEGHVFRLRDHATHKLVKEFSPTAVGGAPDRTKLWKGAATEIPVVTIGEENKPIAEAPPAECFHGGGRAATWHFQNDRKNEPLALSWIDANCKEWNTRMIDPGKKYDVHASEGHAFRIRDASGAILMDVPPISLDTSTYLSVP
jgi:hypothetical protein